MPDYNPVNSTLPPMSRAAISLLPWEMAQSDAELLRGMMEPNSTVGKPTLKAGMALTLATQPNGGGQ